MAVEQMRRLLLVDDEEVFAKTTSRMLDKHGYECETAESASDASEMLRTKKYDCVISDVRMPGNTRFEFIEDLAEAKDSPPVVVITAYPSVDTAVKSLDLRISSYLVKPVEIDDLLSRVEQAIREVRTRRAAGQLMDQPDAGANPAIDARVPVEPEKPMGPDPDKLASLSPRETEVLRHLLEGYRVNTIARKLFISQHTVRNHLKKIFAKLEVRSQTELMEKLKP